MTIPREELKMKIIKSKEDNIRLDIYLLDKVEFSRSQIKKKILSGQIKVNDKTIKAGYNLSLGDIITIEEDEEKILKPQKIDFKILYEDENLAVISKPQNLIVHPGAGNFDSTLVSGLMYKFNHLAKGSDSLRPGIVHRLDKDTSGLMVIAKTDLAYSNLVNAFKNHEVKKTYLAIVEGKINSSGIINKPIGRSVKNRKTMTVTDKNSKEALSTYKLLKTFSNYSLVEINILTGRTHQIRVHFSYIKHPVLGDLTYGHRNKFNIDKQMLHSYKLEFKHPITGESLSFKDEIPIRFKKFISRF